MPDRGLHAQDMQMNETLRFTELEHKACENIRVEV